MKQTLILVGNLGADPQVKDFPDGSLVCNFRMATNRKWTDRRSGEQQEETTWWSVSVWGPQAEACGKYLKRGRLVMVEGRMAPAAHGGPRIYTRGDGTCGADYEVRAFDVKFLDSGDSDQAEPGHDYYGGPYPTTQKEDDEIPF